jgi:hypothetical protein
MKVSKSDHKEDREMNEMTTKYPAIAIIDADGTLYHQVTFREDAPLFDRDAGGKVMGCTRAMPRALAVCQQYGWLSTGVHMHKPGQMGLAVIEAGEDD